jgi:peptidoglycan/LPS O-acetylase OafA/YrhL
MTTPGNALEPLDSKRRIPELDGLRGVAILLVLFFHCFASSNFFPRPLLAIARISWSGVDLFFVLSGFLLGGILLDAKASPAYFKTFYARRAYRILPVYGLTLAVFWLITAVLNIEGGNVAFHWLFSGAFPWYVYATFTQNFAMTVSGTLGSAWLGVTWSLAVEEQFYLTLPLIIRYVSRRRLPYVLGAIIVAAPVCRALLRLFYADAEFGPYVLMPCRADSLMLGVAAALLLKSDQAFEFLVRHKRWIYGIQTLLFAGMIWMLRKEAAVVPEGQLSHVSAGSPQMVEHSLSNISELWLVFRIYGKAAISQLNFTWIALFYSGLLLIAVTQRESLFSRGLRNRWLMAIGIIAYGTYLFHLGVLGLYYGIARGRLPIILNFSDLGLTAVALATTLAVAKLSWVYFEKPLVRRAHKYTYKRDRL